jgi:hypothetical protein
MTQYKYSGAYVLLKYNSKANNSVRKDHLDTFKGKECYIPIHKDRIIKYDDFELFGICDWWVMRNDVVEPWPATEFVVVNAIG